MAGRLTIAFDSAVEATLSTCDPSPEVECHSVYSTCLQIMSHASHIIVRCVLMVSLLLVTVRTTACPWCRSDSPQADSRKAAMFYESFGWNAAAVLAPFPIFGAIVAVIYFAPYMPRRNSDE
jgi:hypothetical protein